MTGTTITPIECPSCLAPVFAPADSAGERIDCAGCGAQLVTAQTSEGLTAILLSDPGPTRGKIRFADLRAQSLDEAGMSDDEAEVALGILVNVAHGLGRCANDTLTMLIAAIGELADRTDNPGEVLAIAVAVLAGQRDAALGVPEVVDG